RRGRAAERLVALVETESHVAARAAGSCRQPRGAVGEHDVVHEVAGVALEPLDAGLEPLAEAVTRVDANETTEVVVVEVDDRRSAAIVDDRTAGQRARGEVEGHGLQRLVVAREDLARMRLPASGRPEQGQGGTSENQGLLGNHHVHLPTGCTLL